MSIISSIYKTIVPSSIRNLFYYINLSIAAYAFLNNYIQISTSVFIIILLIFMRYAIIPKDCDFILSFYERYGKKVEALDGQVIWITGASTGIGEGLALALSKGKVKLALSARSVEKLDNVKKRCIELGKLQEEDILIVPFDMLDYDKHEWAFSTVLKYFGKLNVLVSNAGRSQRALWQNIDVEVDKALFDLNVFSLINLARIVTKHFLEVGGGRHVVMSSAAGVVGVPFSASYTGSKFALMGYFETLRMEKGAKGISINVLCPGPVESNLMEGLLFEKLDDKIDRKRVGNMMSTTRCANLIVVAIANDLKEAWIVDSPTLYKVYFGQYCPALTKWMLHNFDISGSLMKARDGETFQK